MGVVGFAIDVFAGDVPGIYSSLTKLGVRVLDDIVRASVDDIVKRTVDDAVARAADDAARRALDEVIEHTYDEVEEFSVEEMGRFFGQIDGMTDEMLMGGKFEVAPRIIDSDAAARQLVESTAYFGGLGSIYRQVDVRVVPADTPSNFHLIDGRLTISISERANQYSGTQQMIVAMHELTHALDFLRYQSTNSHGTLSEAYFWFQAAAEKKWERGLRECKTETAAVKKIVNAGVKLSTHDVELSKQYIGQWRIAHLYPNIRTRTNGWSRAMERNFFGDIPSWGSYLHHRLTTLTEALNSATSSEESAQLELLRDLTIEALRTMPANPIVEPEAINHEAARAVNEKVSAALQDLRSQLLQSRSATSLRSTITSWRK